MLPVEVANALRRLRSGGQIQEHEAIAALRGFARLPFEFVPFAPFSDRVWELAEAVTSYDAWYVAVAERFVAPLATLDQRLVRAPGPVCTFLTPPGAERVKIPR